MGSYQVKIRYPDGRVRTETIYGTPESIRDWFRRVSGKTKIKGLKKPVFYPKRAKIVSMKPRKKPTQRKTRSFGFDRIW